MMRNSKYNLVPYEVIERAITGDTRRVLAVQEQHKAYRQIEEETPICKSD